MKKLEIVLQFIKITLMFYGLWMFSKFLNLMK